MARLCGGALGHSPARRTHSLMGMLAIILSHMRRGLRHVVISHETFSAHETLALHRAGWDIQVHAVTYTAETKHDLPNIAKELTKKS